MRLSVIVPLYNKASEIARAMDSIFAQTFTQFEVLVVNDGSTDQSVEIVSAYSDPRLRIISQSNKGPGAARNFGIQQSRGALLAFLDGDDEWRPTYLEESLSLLDQSSPDTVAVASGYYEFPRGNSTEALWRTRGLQDEEVRLTANSPLMKAVHQLAYMSSWSTVIKRETVERWGGFYSQSRSTYGEDAYLWLKVLLNEKVRFNLKPLVNFHRECSQLSNHKTGPRPVEPFLLYPDLIRSACPVDRRELAENILCVRAYKTACMLGYWGDWRLARHLVKTFSREGSWRLPYFIPALMCTTPVGAGLGKLWRGLHAPIPSQIKELQFYFTPKIRTVITSTVPTSTVPTSTLPPSAVPTSTVPISSRRV